MDKRLVILVGASGSGKSSWARGREAVVCSADDWFVGADGVYRWTQTGLAPAHRECQRKCSRALMEGAPLVVVDNTNTSLRAIEPYVSMGAMYGYRVSVLVFRKEQDPEVLAKRNAHGVSVEVVKRQLEGIATMLAEWPPSYPAYTIGDL